MNPSATSNIYAQPSRIHASSDQTLLDRRLPINVDIHLNITTKEVGVDHFFENSITPLRRSRKAGSSNNVYCNANRQFCNDNNTFSSVYRNNLSRVKPCWLALLTSRSIENNSAASSLEQDLDSSDSDDSITGTSSFDIAATDSGNSVYQPSNTALSFNRHEKGSKSLLKLKRHKRTWDGPQLNTVLTATLQNKTKRTNL
ncbi:MULTISPECIES: hypothetical protein [Prochlorococcus]|uniref:hypothetical protein n=1 Tax=Prochlorococcus TaxID=1218 RepID=UPI0007B39175|nr:MULTISPECIES: hypothetical protein [Prochlorococcus]NMO83568.1 hypothetical protein [Prochlorococcus sp. P1344]NMP05354.1 hypothetical protein [Prochlorococcus sp. P1361]NMP13355.1 hypothetical protein [Prochlorococcus sp.P1363]